MIKIFSLLTLVIAFSLQSNAGSEKCLSYQDYAQTFKQSSLDVKLVNLVKGNWKAVALADILVADVETTECNQKEIWPGEQTYNRLAFDEVVSNDRNRELVVVLKRIGLSHWYPIQRNTASYVDHSMVFSQFLSNISGNSRIYPGRPFKSHYIVSCRPPQEVYDTLICAFQLTLDPSEVEFADAKWMNLNGKIVKYIKYMRSVN